MGLSVGENVKKSIWGEVSQLILSPIVVKIIIHEKGLKPLNSWVINRKALDTTNQCRIVLQITDNIFSKFFIREFHSFYELKLLWDCQKHAVSFSLIVGNYKASFESNFPQIQGRLSFVGISICFQLAY